MWNIKITNLNFCKYTFTYKSMSEIKCDGKICGLGKHAGGGCYVCPHNNLFVLYPELCKEWDYEKNDQNNIKHPSLYSPGSAVRVWWICKINKCSWYTRISTRAKDNSGCINRCRPDMTPTAKRCTR